MTVEYNSFVFFLLLWFAFKTGKAIRLHKIERDGDFVDTNSKTLLKLLNCLEDLLNIQVKKGQSEFKIFSDCFVSPSLYRMWPFGIIVYRNVKWYCLSMIYFIGQGCGSTFSAFFFLLLFSKSPFYFFFLLHHCVKASGK